MAITTGGTVIVSKSDAIVCEAVAILEDSAVVLRWLEELSIESIAQEKGPIRYLFSPGYSVLANILTISELSTRAGAAQRVSLITGYDLNDACLALRRTLAHSDCTSQGSWLIASEEIGNELETATRFVDGNTILAEGLDVIHGQRACYGIVVGHGREDILYFGQDAICGQRSSSESSLFCAKDDCSYPYSKFHVDLLSADILVLLSCSAGRVGPGLMPAACKLAVSALRNARAVIAPLRHLTYSTELVVLIDRCLTFGLCAGRVAEIANEYQSQRFKETNIFAVFGNAAQSPPCGRMIQDSYEKLSSHCKTIVDHAERIQRIAVQAEDLSVCSEEYARLRNGADSLIRIVETTTIPDMTTVEQHLAALEKSLHLITTLVPLELAGHSAAGYFWLSNTYSLPVLTERRTVCEICGEVAFEYALGRFDGPQAVNRHRLVCGRCGIVWDKPSQENRFILTRTGYTINSGQGVVSSLLQVDVGALNFQMAVSINRGSESQIAWRCQRQDPDREGHDKRQTLEVYVDCLGLSPGVYFLKAFMCCELGTFEASSPFVVTSRPLLSIGSLANELNQGASNDG